MEVLVIVLGSVYGEVVVKLMEDCVLEVGDCVVVG